jgi:hypothetical protein
MSAVVLLQLAEKGRVVYLEFVVLLVAGWIIIKTRVLQECWGSAQR